MSLPLATALSATFEFTKAGALADPSPLPTLIDARYPDATAPSLGALAHPATGVFTATVFASNLVTQVGTYTALAYSSDVTIDSQYAAYRWDEVGVNAVTVNGDKTGYALTTGEHTLISGTDVPAALTAQGYTTTRAGYLDTLNGLVAAIWASGTRTLTVFGFTVSATVTDKTGFSLSTAGVLAIWNQLTADAGIIAGSFGAFINTTLAAILAKVNMITAGSVIVTSPNEANGALRIRLGNAYLNADGRALFASTVFTNVPDLTTASKVSFYVSKTKLADAVVLSATTLYVELTLAEVNTLIAATYSNVGLQAFYVGVTDPITIWTGTLYVDPAVTP